MIYSGALRRLVAFVVDTVVLIGIYGLLGLILGLNFFILPILALPMLGFWFYGGLFLVAWLYFASFESSSRSATIGMQLLGIKVVDLTGKPISFLRATARYFIRAFLRIGVILIFFTKKKQALHDKIARAVVIRS